MCSVVAQAATVYACACGAGAHGSCVPGSNTAPYDTPAKAINTIAQWKTSFQALAAGSNLATCQGGAFDGVATGNMSNAFGTEASPVVIDSYDDSARWSGGAGIRPKFNNTSAAGALSFNKGTPAHTEGLTIKDIEVVGDATNTIWGIIIGADTDFIVIDNVKVSGTVNTAIQLQGGTGVQQAVGDGISQNLTIKNSTISNNKGIGILAGTSRTLIEDNTFTRNGLANTDHDIYMGGSTVVPLSRAIASITGNGVTATLTTSTPHGIAVGSHLTIGVSGSTSSGSGTFNVTGGIGGVVATITGASTLTYAATGTPSASVVGTYQALVDLPITGVVIRNNTISDGNYTALGACNLAHIIFHGDYTNVLVENNLIYETTTSSSNVCSAIDLTSGGYSAPEDYEKFNGVTIRGNTGLNLSYGIALDLSVSALVENNYMHITYPSGAIGGIIMRGKNFVPGTIGSSTLPANRQNPSQNVIRYNTVFVTAPMGGSWGIALNRNTGDPTTGVNHALYGNVVVLGSSATVDTMCFNTQFLTISSQFSRKDRNACYYLGASVPKWENTSSLATIQAGGMADKSDLNSLMAASADPTTGQPFLLTPLSSPAIGTSSALKNAGYAAIGPRTSWGAAVRTDATKDIGAYEFGATLGVVPRSPVPW